MHYICQRKGWGDAEAPYYLFTDALRRHIYIVGKSGAGKTSLLKSFFMSLALSGSGVAIFDVHGDLATELIDLLPAPVTSWVTYLDATDFDFPLAWNPLANVPVEERPTVAAGLVAAFRHVWSDSPEGRMDFTVIIDEFQSITTKAFASILSEARKFNLSLVLVHQFSSQLDPEIRDAIFGNAGTIIAFQVGSDDADILSREFGGRFSPAEFVGLERFNILVKPTPIAGSKQPFRGRTTEGRFHKYARGHRIIRRTRERYAMPRSTIERKMERWIKRWSE